MSSMFLRLFLRLLLLAVVNGRGIQVIIAGVGGATHLLGMVATLTPLPMIRVLVRASALDGLESLLSIV
ncbi:phosphoribosylaminoimidazole carboxylase, chloroplastic isoform X1 [Tanacetum coccineum]